VGSAAMIRTTYEAFFEMNRYFWKNESFFKTRTFIQQETTCGILFWWDEPWEVNPRPGGLGLIYISTKIFLVIH